MLLCAKAVIRYKCKDSKLTSAIDSGDSGNEYQAIIAAVVICTRYGDVNRLVLVAGQCRARQ